MSIAVVIGAGIRFRGFKGWLKEFKEPVPIILPMKILEIFIRPLSLCMRLFGNILGSFIIMKLLEASMPVVVPAILSIYFDIFDGLIQMVVFVFLTTLFIKEAIE
jgi:F-type H+-transporting ATPase subunit a